MKGTIKWYRKEKGYGFITGEDGKDYFLHHSNLPVDEDNIDGQNVEFESKSTQRGVQAVDVKFVDSEGTSEESEELEELDEAA